MKSSKATEEFTIGQLAARFSLATHVLRHWETAGLLIPAARVNGRRRYQREHIARIVMIMRGKAAGLSLEQLRQVFSAPSREVRRDVLAGQHAELTQRIAEAQTSLRLLEHAMDCRAEDFTKCPSFQHLVEVLADIDPLEMTAAKPDA